MGSVDDRLRELRQLEAEAREREAREALQLGGGGGTSGGVSDDWKTSVEGQLKQLHDGLGKVQNWIIVGIAGPLLAIIGLYAYTGSQTTSLNGRIDTVTTRIDTRLAPIDQKIGQVQIDQARLETKIDGLIRQRGPHGR